MKQQLACGILSYCQQFCYEHIILSTKDKEAARFFADLVPKIVQLQGSVTTTETKIGKGITYTVTVDEVKDRVNLLNFYAMLYPEGVTFDLLGGEQGTSAFLAGAFIACGSMSDLEKTYHFEFNISNIDNLQSITSILSDIGFVPRTVQRRGCTIVYFHDSQQIEDILTFLGSPKLTLELMDIKITKERRNAANRMSNCDSANIDKTVVAATQQIKAIEQIFATKGKDSLPPELREIAQLRIDHPEMSLRELGDSLSVPISRSGVNHRLQKLIKLCEL